MINSFQNTVNREFTNQFSTDFDLLDFNNFNPNNNDFNFTTTTTTTTINVEQEQQIASSPTSDSYKQNTFIPTSIYDTENDNNKHHHYFNPSKHQQHTYWAKEDMYVQRTILNAINKDLARQGNQIFMSDKGGLFNTEQINVIDTGTKESELNKTIETHLSFFEGSENMGDKIGDFDDLCFTVDNNNTSVNNSQINSENDVLSAALQSLNSDELIFENERVDINEIINNKQETNNNQDVYHVKSSLMKRVENNNMKIAMPQLQRQDSFNIQIDDDIRNLLTPTIANACQEFLKSLPTPQISQLTNLDTSDLLADLPQLQDDDVPKNKIYANERNPFLTALSAEVKLNQEQEQHQQQTLTLEQIIIDENIQQAATTIQTQKQTSVDSITLDHDYTISPKKRKHSIDEDSESMFTFENTNSSFGISSSTTTTPVVPFKSFPTSKSKSNAQNDTPQQKRKRVKGIYRANDVTNKEELVNYLERRRKNNISSKQSRLTKKTLYQTMDDKSNQLEKDNERLKQQITHLESLTKLLKDVLLQRFTSNIK